jgi:hypothetical protein
MFKYPRLVLHRLKLKQLEKRKVVLLDYSEPEKKPVIDLIDCIKKEKIFLLEYNEAYTIYSTVKAVQKVEGAIAEVGVYMGGSAKLIAEAKGNKELFLFDTFEGLPYDDEHTDKPGFYAGQYPASFGEVQKYLSGYTKTFLYKGIFPQTADPVRDRNFAFVHLDVDIYRSTLDCLDFFYPKMSRGGGHYFP